MPEHVASKPTLHRHGGTCHFVISTGERGLILFAFGQMGQMFPPLPSPALLFKDTVRVHHPAVSICSATLHTHKDMN